MERDIPDEEASINQQKPAETGQLPKKTKPKATKPKATEPKATTPKTIKPKTAKPKASQNGARCKKNNEQEQPNEKLSLEQGWIIANSVRLREINMEKSPTQLFTPRKFEINSWNVDEVILLL